ncbi:hypothetical protein [Actinoplanes sp. NPDC026619]
MLERLVGILPRRTHPGRDDDRRRHAVEQLLLRLAGAIADFASSVEP